MRAYEDSLTLAARKTTTAKSTKHVDEHEREKVRAAGWMDEEGLGGMMKALGVGIMRVRIVVE
jgi:hypothetical protein